MTLEIQKSWNSSSSRSAPRTSFLFVDAEWLGENILNSNLKVIEVSLDPKSSYAEGHIPGAYLFSWNQDLSSKPGTDILERQDFERLMSKIGATHETEIVLYGDSDNLLAIFAFWIFQYYGHDKVKILSGGRDAWPDSGRQYTKILPLPVTPSHYVAREENHAIRPDFAKASERIGSFLSNEQYWLHQVNFVE